MKDTLHYLLQEGFLRFYSWRTEGGGYAGRFFYSRPNETVVQCLTTPEGAPVTVVNGTAYATTHEWYDKYSVEVNSAAEADKLGNVWIQDCITKSWEFRTDILPALSEKSDSLFS